MGIRRRAVIQVSALLRHVDLRDLMIAKALHGVRRRMMILRF